MAHYAVLDDTTNVVTNVIRIDNESIVDENGIELEELGIQICRQVLEDPNAKCVKTSYNSNIRGKYASIGDTYDEDRDIFIPRPSSVHWVYDESINAWVEPIPRPDDTESGTYVWNDEDVAWDFAEFPKKTYNLVSFRNQLTITEQLLWDNPETGTLSQKSIINTTKNNFPLEEGTQKTTELLDLLVSEGVFTQQRLNEIISNL